MTNKPDKAIEYFSQKMHCSQSVLAAFSEECGISEEQAFRLGLIREPYSLPVGF